MSAPTAKKIAQVFRLTDQEAIIIRKVLKGELPTKAFKLTDYERQYGAAERRLIVVNKIIDGHGVEALADRDDNSSSYLPHAIYINTGDTYSPTILFDYHTRNFSLTTWGDYVERHPKWFD